MEEIKYYETIKEEKKKSFISLLKSKTNFLPKLFSEQLWNEPNLKDSLIKVSCIEEEKTIINNISNHINNNFNNVENIETEIVEFANVRTLSA